MDGAFIVTMGENKFESKFSLGNKNPFNFPSVKCSAGKLLNWNLAIRLRQLFMQFDWEISDETTTGNSQQ